MFTLLISYFGISFKVKMNYLITMRSRFIIFFYLFILSKLTVAQNSDYVNPLKIPLLLSGSFAELRSNHFHSGIDIKTGGETGEPVYSVADGFISRIVVSPSGFGKALYITHPNGTSSVYGHLDKFRDDIKNFITDLQYKSRSFSIDKQLNYSQFPVKKDELIGYTGNSGSSGGPHLHFEIRDSKNEMPLNPLKYGFPVIDNIPPKIYSLMITPIDDHSHVEYGDEKKIYPVYLTGETYSLNRPVIPVYGKIGFAVQANDFFDFSENICGVYSIELKIDGELYYLFKMDRFSFDESRYINSHIDYEEYIKSRKRFHKTWLDPGNNLSIYNYVRERGIFEVKDGNPHPVTIEIKDIHGNKSVVKFSIISRYKYLPASHNEYDKLLSYDKRNYFHSDSIMADFPAHTFYKDLKFTYDKMPSNKGLLSGIHILHNKTVPVHKHIRLSVQISDRWKNLYDKLILVNVDTVSGRFYSAGGFFNNGWITANIRAFGNYAVAVDTIPPKIIPLSIKNKNLLTESSKIRFLISDDLSGIESYEGYLDDKWMLFDYDAKNDLIVHDIDPERFEMGKKHHLILHVTDSKGNRSVYEASFHK